MKETEDGTRCISYSSGEGESRQSGFALMVVPLPMGIRFKLQRGWGNKTFPAVEVSNKTIHIPL
jgi:hypothetical protein